MYCNVIKGRGIMSFITLRISEKEEQLIKEYAKVNNISISELFRSSVLERIENDNDLKLYHEAMKEHHHTPGDISFDDMMKGLNLDE
jgi:hypothetical protein